MLAYFSGAAGAVDAGWFALEQLALGGLTTETPVALLKHLLRNVTSNIRTEGDTVVGQVGEMHLRTERCLTFQVDQKGVQVRTSCTTSFDASHNSTGGLDARKSTTVA